MVIMTIQKIKVQTITHSFSVRLPDLDSAPAGIDMKSNPADALEQIRRKKYYENYLTENELLFIVGIEFDEEKRNIFRFETELPIYENMQGQILCDCPCHSLLSSGIIIFMPHSSKSRKGKFEYFFCINGLNA